MTFLVKATKIELDKMINWTNSEVKWGLTYQKSELKDKAGNFNTSILVFEKANEAEVNALLETHDISYLQMMGDSN